jgi:hypothetical protein
MVAPKTTGHFLPAPAEIVFKGPITYFLGETNNLGLLNLKLENKNKKFICIEWKEK